MGFKPGTGRKLDILVETVARSKLQEFLTDKVNNGWEFQDFVYDTANIDDSTISVTVVLTKDGGPRGGP